MAIVLIAIVVSGFSVVAFSRPGGVMETPLFLHMHGAVFLAWFVLLAVQASLIGRGSVALHKRLGQISIALAIAIVVIGYFVVSHAIGQPDKTIAGRPAVIGSIFPIFDIINFTAAYSLGIANRANGIAHKRFMLSSAILMIDPAMARLVLGLGGHGVLILVTEVALFAAMLCYDFYKLRRPHWATLIALGLYIIAFTVKLNIESITWWPGFLTAVF
ncbi:MAG: hypothetical protein AAFR64_03960 [Pseudomonadota bacterium]